jgi:hypothetical protein
MAGDQYHQLGVLMYWRQLKECFTKLSSMTDLQRLLPVTVSASTPALCSIAVINTAMVALAR